MTSSPRTYCWWNVVPEPISWAQVLLPHSFIAHMILIVEYDFDLFVMEIVRKNWNNKHCIITIFEAIGAISVLYICFYGAKGKKLSTKWDWSQRMKKVQEMASFSYPIFFPPFFLLILLKSYYFFVYEWVIWVIRFFFFLFFFSIILVIL